MQHMLSFLFKVSVVYSISSNILVSLKSVLGYSHYYI